MRESFPDGLSVSDAFWMDYDAGMMRMFVIFLGLILAQALVLFLASCFAGCGDQTDRRNQNRERSAAATNVPKTCLSIPPADARPSSAAAAFRNFFGRRSSR